MAKLLPDSCKTDRNTAKDKQKYKTIFLLVFSGSRVTNLRYTYTQELNCGCQNMDKNTFYCFTCAHRVDFSHLMSFYPTLRILIPNSKNVGNITIIANTNIFIG